MTANPTKTQPNEKVEAAHARLASTGRNDPCFCGSGKKYKKCHLADVDKAVLARLQAEVTRLSPFGR